MIQIIKTDLDNSRSNSIDLLTVIPVTELDKGVAFVRTMIADYVVEQAEEDDTQTDDALSHIRWDHFWDDYFIP